ncbi:WD40-repeat-containing domain protein, partial [Baffinella frigidus]
LSGHAGHVLSVAISADGRSVVSGSRDNTVKIWEAGSAEAVTLRGHQSAVWCVAVSADGTRVVSGSADNLVKLWDVETGGEVCSRTLISEHTRICPTFTTAGGCVY